MTETSGSNEPKKQNEKSKLERDFFSRSWWSMNAAFVFATWLCYEGKIDGSGWVTAIIGLYAAWQGRGWAKDKLIVGG